MPDGVSILQGQSNCWLLLEVAKVKKKKKTGLEAVIQLLFRKSKQK